MDHTDKREGSPRLRDLTHGLDPTIEGHIDDWLKEIFSLASTEDLKVPTGSVAKGEAGVSPLSGYYNSQGAYEKQKVKTTTKKVMTYDVDVQFAFSALTAPIISAPWGVECADPDIASFLEGALTPIWRGLIQAAMEAVFFGFQAFEKIYDIQDVEVTDDEGESQVLEDRAVYSELFDVDPEKVEIKKDKDGNLLGYEVNGTLIKVDLTGKSIDKGMILTLPRVRWGDYEGMARLDVAYPAWWTKSAAFRLMMRYLERHGDPPLKGSAPMGVTHDQNGKSYDNFDLMLEIMRKIKGHSSVVIPHELDEAGEPAWTLDMLADDSDRGDMWLNVLEHLSVLIMRAFLSPEKTLIEGSKTGSFALVKEQRTLALQNVQMIQTTVFEQLSNQALPPLVLANFGEGAPKARLVPGALDQASLDILSEMLGFIVDYEQGQVPERPLTELVDRIALLEALRIPMDKDLTEGQEDPDDLPDGGGETGTREIPDAEKQDVEREPGEMSSVIIQEPLELATTRQIQRKYLKLVRDAAETFKTEVADEVFQNELDRLTAQVEKALNQKTPTLQARALDKIKVSTTDYGKELNAYLTELHKLGRESIAEELSLGTFPPLTPGDRSFIKTLSNSLSSDRASKLIRIAKVAGEGAIRWGQTAAQTIFAIRTRAEKLLKNLSNQTTAVSEAWRGYQDGRRSGAEGEFNAEDPIVAGEFVNESPTAPICQALAGEVIRADDPRFFAYHPPLHHNCTTTMRYIRRSEFDRTQPEPFKRPPQSVIDAGDEFFIPKELLSSLYPIDTGDGSFLDQLYLSMVDWAVNGPEGDQHED